MQVSEGFEKALQVGWANRPYRFKGVTHTQIHVCMRVSM